MSRIVIVSGPPGAGKSTVARGLARHTSAPLAMHVRTDDIYTYVQKGFVEPWRPESQHQNVTLMDAMAAQAAICAKAGYEVYVDGIVGAWFFDPWQAAAREHALDLRYVLLRPSLEVTIERAVARTQPGAMRDARVVEQMWTAFHTFAVDPDHVIDTTNHAHGDTEEAVRAGLEAGRFRLA